jgi:hypothetical protein
MCLGRGAARPRASFVNVRTFGRWDCINARQRERAKESRFAACTSLLTSQPTRRIPPKCGAFRLQTRDSPLRQTGCWREPDSNSRSHLYGCGSLCGSEPDGNNRNSRTLNLCPLASETDHHPGLERLGLPTGPMSARLMHSPPALGDRPGTQIGTIPRTAPVSPACVDTLLPASFSLTVRSNYFRRTVSSSSSPIVAHDRANSPCLPRRAMISNQRLEHSGEP